MRSAPYMNEVGRTVARYCSYSTDLVGLGLNTKPTCYRFGPNTSGTQAQFNTTLDKLHAF